MPDYISNSPEETKSMGKDFSKNLTKGNIVALYGELGSGKTQFIKGICKGLGVKEIVTSPTFIIINEYTASLVENVFHFDLYRIKNKEEVFSLGFEEYMTRDGIILIEWPELVEDELPKETFKIFMSHSGNSENTRSISMKGT